MGKNSKNTAIDTTATPIVTTQAPELVIDGLAEATKTDKVARIKALKAAAKGTEAAVKKAAARHAKITDLANGTNDSGKNPKLTHNPQIVIDTLRAASDGELINDLPAKGWVVAIACETCAEHRLVNTQDAFQVRFCETHKADARKASGKARRAARKDAELNAMSETDLDAQIAALEAAATAVAS